MKPRALLAVLLAAASLGAAEKKNVLMIAGRPSHAPGEHEHNAGIQLLAAGLRQGAADLVEVDVALNGEWPSPERVAKADTIVIYSDGGGEQDGEEGAGLHGGKGQSCRTTSLI
ncbi:MAG: hypothetical protein ACKOQ9_07800, partial [Verrucomicrobiota bacterium]